MNVGNTTKIEVGGDTAETAGKFYVKDSSVTGTDNGGGTATGKHFNGTGYGQFVFDNATVNPTSRYSISLSDHSSFVLKGATDWQSASRIVSINMTGDSAFTISEGSSFTHFMWTEGSPFSLSDSAKFTVTGTDSKLLLNNGGNMNAISLAGNSTMEIADGGTATGARTALTLSEGASLDIRDGGSFSSTAASANNGAPKLMLKDSSSVSVSSSTGVNSTLSYATGFEMDGDSSMNIGAGGVATFNGAASSAGGNAKINISDTGILNGNSAVAFSDSAQLNYIGVTGSAPTNMTFAGSSSMNVKGSSAITSGDTTLGESTSVNVTEASSLTLGNTTIGGDAAKITASGAGSKLILPNKTVSINDGGSMSVLDGASMDMNSANATKISVGGTNAGTAGVFTLKDSSITTSANPGNLANAKVFEGTGYGSFVFDNSTVDAGNRFAISLSDNSTMTMKGASSWVTGNRINSISLGGNSEFKISEGSSFTHFNWTEGSPFSISGNAKFTVTGENSTVKFGNGNNRNVVNISGHGSYNVENGASSAPDGNMKTQFILADNASVNVSGATFKTTTYGEALNVVDAGGSSAFNVKNGGTLDMAGYSQMGTYAFSDGASFNISGGSTVAANFLSTVSISGNASMTVSGASTVNVFNLNIGAESDTGKSMLNVVGSGNNIYRVANGRLNVWGASNTTAVAQIGGGIAFIADASGISSINVWRVEAFSGVIAVDFSNFIGDAQEGKKYTFDLIVASSNAGDADWSAIAADFIGTESAHGDRVIVNLASTDDTWEIKYANNTLRLEYTTNSVIPEPGAFAAAFGAIALLAAARRRRE